MKGDETIAMVFLDDEPAERTVECSECGEKMRYRGPSHLQFCSEACHMQWQRRDIGCA